MIKIKKLLVGELATNCYILCDEETQESLVIDPGDDADYISRVLLTLDIKPKVILLTHGHYDHALALSELQVNFKLKALMNPKDTFLLKRITEYEGRYLKDKPLLGRIDKSLDEETRIALGGKKLRVIETPGHTPGSVSLYFKEAKAVFSGDLIFENGELGRTDFFYSSSDDLKASISKIFTLPLDTVIYPGHGRETTVSKLKKFYKFSPNA